MSDFMATLGNALTYGGMVTVIGLLVVFTGLALLIIITLTTKVTKGEIVK